MNPTLKETFTIALILLAALPFLLYAPLCFKESARRRGLPKTLLIAAAILLAAWLALLLWPRLPQ